MKVEPPLPSIPTPQPVAKIEAEADLHRPAPERVSDFVSAFESRSKTQAKPPTQRNSKKVLPVVLISLLVVGGLSWAIWQFGGAGTKTDNAPKPQNTARNCTSLLTGVKEALTAGNSEQASADLHEAETSCSGNQLAQLQTLKMSIADIQTKTKACQQSEAKAKDLLGRGLPSQAQELLEANRQSCSNRSEFIELGDQPAKSMAEAKSKINQARLKFQSNNLDEADGLIAGALMLDVQVAGAEVLRKESLKRRGKLPVNIGEKPATVVASTDPVKATNDKNLAAPPPAAQRTEPAKFPQPNAARTAAVAAAADPLPAPIKQELIILDKALKPRLIAIKTSQPDYPPGALRSETTGQVVASFTVNTDGSVGNIKIINAKPRGVFERTVQSTLTSWKFQPIAEPQTVTRTFNFSL